MLASSTHLRVDLKLQLFLQLFLQDRNIVLRPKLDEILAHFSSAYKESLRRKMKLCKAQRVVASPQVYLRFFQLEPELLHQSLLLLPLLLHTTIKEEEFSSS